MERVTRVKKTKQIVYPMFKADSTHTMCLFPFPELSRKGRNGIVQPVRDDNLTTDREELYGTNS